jgi:ATP phosphoribosyltransferase regulatory subunit HisZ
MQPLQLLGLTLGLLLGSAKVVELLAQSVSLAGDWALRLRHLLPRGG